MRIKIYSRENYSTIGRDRRARLSLSARPKSVERRHLVVCQRLNPERNKTKRWKLFSSDFLSPRFVENKIPAVRGSNNCFEREFCHRRPNTSSRNCTSRRCSFSLTKHSRIRAEKRETSSCYPTRTVWDLSFFIKHIAARMSPCRKVSLVVTG